MAAKTILRGITWNHSRGFVSVVATAQRFCEMRPEVEITWEKRSLQEFADAPIQGLAEQYDLLVIDHPWAGYAAYSDVLMPLQEIIPADFMRDQAENSVGQSHPSYIFDGGQCALAIDAATPVAAYRADLLERYELEQPQSWRDLLALARQDRVIMPGIPIDTLMNFYMLCATQGEAPFVDDEWAVSDEMSLQALEQLRELASLCPRDIFNWNPIAVYEALSRRDDYRLLSLRLRLFELRARRLFGQAANLRRHGRHRRAGAAVSQRWVALDWRFPRVVKVQKSRGITPCSQQVQRYSVRCSLRMAGQPGHRSAWLDAEVNRRSHNYFRNTLPALDRAYLRPRFPGYLHFQDHAGAPIREYLMQGGDARAVLEQLKRLFEEAKALDLSAVSRARLLFAELSMRDEWEN